MDLLSQAQAQWPDSYHRNKDMQQLKCFVPSLALQYARRGLQAFSKISLPGMHL